MAKERGEKEIAMPVSEVLLFVGTWGIAEGEADPTAALCTEAQVAGSPNRWPQAAWGLVCPHRWLQAVDSMSKLSTVKRHRDP